MSDDLYLTNDTEKAAFNARAKASMRQFLRGKSWAEKVASIRRMNVAHKLAKAALLSVRGGK